LWGFGFILRRFLTVSSNVFPNTSPPSPLLGARLKADRAKRHLEELIRVTQPLSGQFFGISHDQIVSRADNEPLGYQLTYRPTKPVPEILALVIGDCIHNARSALDHLASTIIRTKDAAAKPYFPIPKNGKDMEKTGWLLAMEDALPGSKGVILKEIWPVDDRGFDLWAALQTFDIDDKHNLLVPTVTVGFIDNLNATDGSSTWESCAAGGDAAHPIKLVSSNKPLSMNGKPNVSVHVAFGQVSVLAGEAVIPTLSDITNIVDETLKAFDAII
jgi:hypothetical protein